MRRALLASVPVLFVLGGCVSRSTHRETLGLLEECRTDKVAAQTAMSSCEERYTKEVRRWEDMDAVVAKVVPQALDQFKSEREQILGLVPEAARQEVGGYLDELTDAMGHGFQVLRDQNESIALQLEVAQTKLDALQVRADSIGTDTRTINETLEGSVREARQQQRELQRGVRQQATELVEMVQEFDRMHLIDRNSDERLKLNRNQRETIQQFHDRLVAALSKLGDSRGESASAQPARAASPDAHAGG